MPEEVAQVDGDEELLVEGAEALQEAVVVEVAVHREGDEVALVVLSVAVAEVSAVEVSVEEGEVLVDEGEVVVVVVDSEVHSCLYIPAYISLCFPLNLHCDQDIR